MKKVFFIFYTALLFGSCTLEPVTGPNNSVGPPPATFSMDQNYPNPFIDTTRVKYGVPQQTALTIVVYDQFHEEVRTIVNNGSHGAGIFIAVWDGKDQRGFKVKAGTYFIEMRGYVPQAAIITVNAIKQ